MVTAQCLRKNASGCTKKPGYVMLTDRKGFHFPVKCDCSFRTNIICNSERLMLFGEADTLKRAGLREAVLLFTDEDAGGTKAALALAGDILKRGMTPEIRGKYTKGHFNRGVE
jgi:putative protease